MKKLDFKNLFVLDLANNHQGDLNHAKLIISKFGELVNSFSLNATIKFQFRQLETFIHPEYNQYKKNKHIARFQETRLNISDYKILLDLIKKKQLLSCCTPFDEASVDLILDMNIDLIKLASCSATDWPLIEKISNTNKPVIFSTGGLNLNEIDDLVSFFEHRGVDFSIMHCVSIYPTPVEKFNLNFIETLKRRYPYRVIGWSTHEDPNDCNAIKIAYSKGARMFERHIGIETEKYKLNAYSSNPEQFLKWIESYVYSVKACGSYKKSSISDEERLGIESLIRGVYVKDDLLKGEKILSENIFFAMPYNNNQIKSGDFKEEIVSKKNLKKNEPLYQKDVIFPTIPETKIIKNSIHEVKAMLREARIELNSEFEVEYSHHYGLDNFRKTGAVIINCINRSYCKKLIILLPGQEHPAHFHRKKEETFQVLTGGIDVYLDGHHRRLNPGQTCLIQPGVWHSFQSDLGCIFEEISTTHYNNDSIYKDKKINGMKRENRKTIVDNWGRFQI
tara:strand:+ start:306 stop:1823 length:1518 start_codon:yes stop_codon:yes gene_type:complete